MLGCRLKLKNYAACLMWFMILVRDATGKERIVVVIGVVGVAYVLTHGIYIMVGNHAKNWRLKNSEEVTV